MSITPLRTRTNSSGELTRSGSSDGSVARNSWRAAVEAAENWVAPAPSVTSLEDDVRMKEEFKYDPAQEQGAKDWIAAMLAGEARPAFPPGVSFVEAVRSGAVLCRVVNAACTRRADKRDAKPLIPKIHESSVAFRCIENISNYTKACRALGVAVEDSFDPTDLFEQKNMTLVISQIFVLAQLLYKEGYEVPEIRADRSSQSLWVSSLVQGQQAAASILSSGEDDAAPEPLTDTQRELLAWANAKLAKLKTPVVLRNLSSDFRTAMPLVRIIQVTSQVHIGPYVEEPTELIDLMQNASLVLRFLYAQTFERVGCSGANIIQGSAAAIETLLAFIRDKFDLEYLFLKTLNEDIAAAAASGADDDDTVDISAAAAADLLSHMQEDAVVDTSIWEVEELHDTDDSSSAAAASSSSSSSVAVDVAEPTSTTVSTDTAAQTSSDNAASATTSDDKNAANNEERAADDEALQQQRRSIVSLAISQAAARASQKRKQERDRRRAEEQARQEQQALILKQIEDEENRLKAEEEEVKRAQREAEAELQRARLRAEELERERQAIREQQEAEERRLAAEQEAARVQAAREAEEALRLAAEQEALRRAQIEAENAMRLARQRQEQLLKELHEAEEAEEAKRQADVQAKRTQVLRERHELESRVEPLRVAALQKKDASRCSRELLAQVLAVAGLDASLTSSADELLVEARQREDDAGQAVAAAQQAVEASRLAVEQETERVDSVLVALDRSEAQLRDELAAAEAQLARASEAMLPVSASRPAARLPVVASHRGAQQLAGLRSAVEQCTQRLAEHVERARLVEQSEAARLDAVGGAMAEAQARLAGLEDERAASRRRVEQLRECELTQAMLAEALEEEKLAVQELVAAEESLRAHVAQHAALFEQAATGGDQLAPLDDNKRTSDDKGGADDYEAERRRQQQLEASASQELDRLLALAQEQRVQQAKLQEQAEQRRRQEQERVADEERKRAAQQEEEERLRREEEERVASQQLLAEQQRLLAEKQAALEAKHRTLQLQLEEQERFWTEHLKREAERAREAEAQLQREEEEEAQRAEQERQQRAAEQAQAQSAVVAVQSVQPPDGPLASTGSWLHKVRSSKHLDGSEQNSHGNSGEDTRSRIKDFNTRERVRRAQAVVRRRVAEEAFKSEEAFVRQLLSLQRNFTVPYSRMADVSADQVITATADVERLCKFHSELLGQLGSRAKAWTDESELSDIFFDFCPQFVQVYETYCTGYVNTAAARKSLHKTRSYVTQAKKFKKEGDGISVASVLALPFQRSVRYVRILQEMRKYTLPATAEFAALGEVTAMVSSCLDHLCRCIARSSASESLTKKLVKILSAASSEGSAKRYLRTNDAQQWKNLPVVSYDVPTFPQMKDLPVDDSRSSDESREILYFQYHIARLIDLNREMMLAQNELVHIIHARMTNAPLPRLMAGEHLMITCRLDSVVDVSVLVNPTDTVEFAIRATQSRLNSQTHAELKDADPQSLCFRLLGENSYVADISVPIHSIVYVRHQFERGARVIFQLCFNPNVEIALDLAPSTPPSEPSLADSEPPPSPSASSSSSMMLNLSSSSPASLSSPVLPQPAASSSPQMERGGDKAKYSLLKKTLLDRRGASLSIISGPARKNTLLGDAQLSSSPTQLALELVRKNEEQAGEADKDGRAGRAAAALRERRTCGAIEQAMSRLSGSKIICSLLGLTPQQLNLEPRAHQCYPLAAINRLFEFRILCLPDFEASYLAEELAAVSALSPGNRQFWVEVALFHGAFQLAEPTRTLPAQTPIWSEWALVGIPVCSIPREARLCITLYLRYNPTRHAASSAVFRGQKIRRGKSIPVAWVNMSVAGPEGFFRSGVWDTRMWPGGPAAYFKSISQPSDRKAVSISLEFPRGDHPIMVASATGGGQPSSSSSSSSSSVFQADSQVNHPSLSGQSQTADDYPLKKILLADPLYSLNSSEKKLMWKFRQYTCKNDPIALPKLLLAIDWTDQNQVEQIHELLLSWPLLPPLAALQLLDAKFMDALVREYAVKCISHFTDNELCTFLLQIVQSLKYEPTHTSALGSFLILRAVRAPQLVGTALFWFFESESRVQEVETRWRLFRKALLQACGTDVGFAGHDYLQSAAIMRQIQTIAEKAKTIKESKTRLDFVQATLRDIPWERSVMPINTRQETSGLIADKCKVMQSFTLPLWLEFQNNDPLGEPIRCIFKVGDDIRQDILTLQVLNLMDQLWSEQDLDLYMSPYCCVSTGIRVGMIEVVMNARTTASIYREIGGGALGALQENALALWLKQQNPEPADYAKAVRRFIRSLAGYSVASYVLGLGDRHNDNIMVRTDGCLLHIDFAHFLGNFLKFAGVSRETTPFVLTPDFVYVMGGTDSPGFAEFVDLCCRAYTIVRHNAHLLMTIFSMMLSSGLDQLRSPKDILFLRQSLMLGHTDEEARQLFIKLIRKSAKNKRILLNNVTHMWVNS